MYGVRMGGRTVLAGTSVSISGERGFTLIETMIGIVFLTVGLLAVADVFPQGLALGRYGKDQTAAANLAQQEVEYLKTLTTAWQTTCTSPPTAINCAVADYYALTPNSTQALRQTVNQNGQQYVRDVQVQVWTYADCRFGVPGQTFTCPDGTTVTFPGTTQYPAPAAQPSPPYIFRVSVATHWLARGQTIFTSGNTSSPNGCVSGGAAVSTGLGCVQISTFISP